MAEVELLGWWWYIGAQCSIVYWEGPVWYRCEGRCTRGATPIGVNEVYAWGGVGVVDVLEGPDVRDVGHSHLCKTSSPGLQA